MASVRAKVGGALRQQNRPPLRPPHQGHQDRCALENGLSRHLAAIATQGRLPALGSRQLGSQHQRLPVGFRKRRQMLVGSDDGYAARIGDQRRTHAAIVHPLRARSRGRGARPLTRSERFAQANFSLMRADLPLR